MLRPIEHVDPRLGEAGAAPRARVLTATVTRRVDRWYVCLTIEAADYHPGRRHQARSQHEGRRFVGIDRGLTAFAVVAGSDGVEVCRFAAPRPLARRQRRLRRRSRGVARTQRGSRNRARAAGLLAREHHRVAMIRRSFLHEVSSQLTKTHSGLALEDLPVANLIRNKRLARAITDAAWSEFARQLRYKTAWLGGDLVVCDRWFASTKTCSRCGRAAQQMALGHGPSVAMVAGWSWTGTATVPRISPPGPRQPNWMSPRSRTAKQAARSLMPWRGRRWPSLRRWRNRPQ
jgi:putative transposase